MSNNASDTAQVLIFPPLLYLAPLLLGRLAQVVYPLPGLPRALALALGSVLIGGALALLVTALQVMRQVGTNVDPNRPATTLVVKGPFRISRNPIYLAFTLLYCGIAVVANSFWAVLLLPLVLIILRYGVIAREEQYLERKFGGEYLAYKSRIRRWI